MSNYLYTTSIWWWDNVTFIVTFQIIQINISWELCSIPGNPMKFLAPETNKNLSGLLGRRKKSSKTSRFHFWLFLRPEDSPEVENTDDRPFLFLIKISNEIDYVHTVGEIYSVHILELIWKYWRKSDHLIFVEI